MRSLFLACTLVAVALCCTACSDSSSNSLSDGGEEGSGDEGDGSDDSSDNGQFTSWNCAPPPGDCVRVPPTPIRSGRVIQTSPDITAVTSFVSSEGGGCFYIDDKLELRVSATGWGQMVAVTRSVKVNEVSLNGLDGLEINGSSTSTMAALDNLVGIEDGFLLALITGSLTIQATPNLGSPGFFRGRNQSRQYRWWGEYWEQQAGLGLGCPFYFVVSTGDDLAITVLIDQETAAWPPT